MYISFGIEIMRCCREKLRAAEELRKAEKVGVLEMNKLLKLYNKRLQWFHSQLFAFNNRMERIKNLFNWTHPKKTELVLFALVFLSGLFILFPSRYVFMAAGLCKYPPCECLLHP